MPLLNPNEVDEIRELVLRHSLSDVALALGQIYGQTIDSYDGADRGVWIDRYEMAGRWYVAASKAGL